MCPIFVFCQSSLPDLIDIQPNSTDDSVRISWHYDGIYAARLVVFASENNANNMRHIRTDYNPELSGSFVYGQINLVDTLYYFRADLIGYDGVTYSSPTLCAIYFKLDRSNQSQSNPTLSCPNYPFSENQKLYVWRKYENADFQLLDFYITDNNTIIDSTISNCDESRIDYYISDNQYIVNSKSFSAVKYEYYQDENHPEKPVIIGLTVVDDAELVVSWLPSGSSDVEHYRIETYGDYSWFTLDIVSGDERAYSISSDFCSTGNFNSEQYTIIAVDTCGQESVYNLEEDIFTPLILYPIEFDGCNTLIFSWNDAHRIRNTISGYKLTISDDNQSEQVNLTSSDLSYSDNKYFYHHDISTYSAGNYSCVLKAFNSIGDSSVTCSQSFYVDEIANPPDRLDMYSIIYDESTKKNVITAVLDTMPSSGIKYIVYTKPRSTEQHSDLLADTIAVIDKFPLNSKYQSFEDVVEATDVYTYYLVAKNACNESFQDSAYMSSIYLMGEEGIDNQMFRLCFSPLGADLSYNIPLNHFIVREYTNPATNETIGETFESSSCSATVDGTPDFVEYCREDFIYNHCDYDLDFYYAGGVAVTVKWLIEARRIVVDEDTLLLGRSNPVSLNPDIVMPNAFIAGADNEINRLFGPMNYNSENIDDIESFDFQIYNSWGQRVWSSNNASESFRWDGNSTKGNPLPTATYVYYISIKLYKMPEALIKRGSVTLIRRQ